MDFCKELSWRCRNLRPIHHVDLLGLIHLYQPIIGANGIALYLTLQYQLPIHKQSISELHQHSFLLRLCSLSLQQMVEARYLLEGVGLLNCYEKNEPILGQHYEYESIPPLTPRRFFQSDVLCVSLFNILGKEKFQSLRDQFHEEQEVPSETSLAINITKSFQDVFGRLSSDQLEKTAEIAKEIGCFTENIREEYSQGKYPEYKGMQDFSLIKMRLGTLVSEEIWTDELMRQLGEICFLYQLDDWDLLKALQNPYITSNKRIDIERLRSFIKNEYQLRFGRPPMVISRQQQVEVAASQALKVQENKMDLTDEQKHLQQLMEITPLELLSHYQGGAKVPTSDAELVSSLVHQYQLPFGVINVLLEYVLLKYEYRLPRNLVEKIAGHWKRLGIQTAEAAMVQAKKEDWEMKKKSTSSATGAYRKNVKKESKPLPKAVAQQLEKKKRKPEQPPKEYSRDEIAKKKAQIEAKIKMLYETPLERDTEKENWS